MLGCILSKPVPTIFLILNYFVLTKMMSVGVTENFKINLEVLSAHLCNFYFWAKNCQKRPKNCKVSQNICGPQAFSAAAKTV
jgi:hypothetical protein